MKVNYQLKNQQEIESLHNFRSRLIPAKNQFVKNSLGVSTIKGIEIIKYSSIIHCQAEGNYCRIICRDGREVLASKTLKHIQTALPKSNFLRVHQSHIISINDISSIQFDCVLLNGVQPIPISRAKRNEVLKAVQQWISII